MNEQITGKVFALHLPCNIPKMEWLRVPVCVSVQNFPSEVVDRGRKLHSVDRELKSLACYPSPLSESQN